MLHRTGHRIAGARRGVASVELAVLLPFLAFIFLITVDFSRIFYYLVTLNNCARNGAYYAANYPGIYSYGSARQACEADGGNIIPALTDANVTVMYSTSAAGPYTSAVPIPTGYVQVTVNWPFNCITNYPGIPATMNLSRAVIMKVAPIVPTFN